MALGKETNKTADGWFPSIIGPNEYFARNVSGEEDVVPTPYYAATSMPKYRKNPRPSDVVNEEYIDTSGIDMNSGAGIGRKKGY